MKIKGNQTKWMKRIKEMSTFLMGLILACFIVSLIYFCNLNYVSDRFIHHETSTFKIKEQASSAPAENTRVSEKIGEIKEQASSAPEESIRVSEKIVEIMEQSSSAPEKTATEEKIGEEIEQVKTQIKPSSVVFDSNYLSTVCEIQGEVLIYGNSSSVIFASNSQTNETWRIQPYSRKFDTNMMTRIPNVTITPSYDPQKDPKCAVNHNITAVIFAVGGYTGNFWHDFTDVLVPLFITARQFEGEVQFFISNIQHWWVFKYNEILKKLSNYEILNFERENITHCYPHVVVGLYNHKDFSMDPSITPNNYSMVDFTNFMRSVYSLKRTSIKLRENTKTKPRLLIIPRKGSRSIINVNQTVQFAEELGFEVVADEPKFYTNVGDFARFVNSFDVLMGVHGAGLTNLVFLPTNSILIQIVPFGNLDGICDHIFGDPARDAKLNYLQSSISEEESTLIEKYSKDDPVFREPQSIHNKGWGYMANIYFNQNVKLNVTRFRPVLEKALEFLK